jgi:hypothetical protein
VNVGLRRAVAHLKPASLRSFWAISVISVVGAALGRDA